MWYDWRARARGATISQNADGRLPGGEGHGCSPHTKRGSLGWEVGQTVRFGGHLPPGLAGRQALKLGLDNESPSSPAERMDKQAQGLTVLVPKLLSLPSSTWRPGRAWSCVPSARRDVGHTHGPGAPGPRHADFCSPPRAGLPARPISPAPHQPPALPPRRAGPGGADGPRG